MAAVARPTAGGNLLDLTCSAAAAINKHIKDIHQAYDDDFAAAPATSADTQQPPVLIHNNTLAVQVDFTPLDDYSYKEKLAEWNRAVDSYVDVTLDSFVQSHVALIVDDQADTARLKLIQP